MYKTKPAQFREGMSYWGGEAKPRMQGAGALKAFDVNGREMWATSARYPIVGSVLSTAGDVVFVGHRLPPMTRARATYSGSSRPAAASAGGPITYRVNGKQYVAVPSGWGGWLKGFAPELYAAPRGMMLFVFALP